MSLQTHNSLFTVISAMDHMQLLLEESFIRIYIDNQEKWLYVDWTGKQTADTVVYGCERILNLLKEQNIQKVLNDNTNVTSNWSEASEWVATNWFPRMNEAGLKYFAWVYSPDSQSKSATDETLLQAKKSIAITFDDLETAKTWLRSV